MIKEEFIEKAKNLVREGTKDNKSSQKDFEKDLTWTFSYFAAEELSNYTTKDLARMINNSDLMPINTEAHVEEILGDMYDFFNDDLEELDAYLNRIKEFWE